MRRSHRTTKRPVRTIPGQKPRGCLQQRVKAVGPEHFAIIPVDCGKPEARTRVADFYGNVLLEPFSIPITRPGLDMACCLIRQTLTKHEIRDCVCAIETTGRYHLPLKQTFQREKWDVRDVHPYTSSLIRRAADLGTKTDDIDLAAIHRASVDGLAMQPEVLDAASQQWRLLVRHRRDLVDKCTRLKNQLKETFHAYLPGYAGLWEDENFWKSPIPATIATTFDSPQAMQQADGEVFRQAARDAQSVIHNKTIDRIRGWTYQAAPIDQAYPIHYRHACSLWRDLRGKWQEIRVLELEIAHFLCHSPCVLLLAFPGINVITASDYGGELGPMTNYANSKSIAGRAGLYPSRSQSCQTDYPNGRLVVRRNPNLRGALMRIANCLSGLNQYFIGLAKAYEERHPDYDPKVAVGRAFSRLSYYILAGESLPAHAAIHSQEKILQKLLEFFNERKAEPDKATSAITAAMERLPAATLRPERAELKRKYDEVKNKCRKPGVRRLCEILPTVLIRINQLLDKEPNTEANNQPTRNNMMEDGTHGS